MYAVALHDDPKIAIDPRGPEVVIPGALDPLKTKPPALRIHHQVDRGDLDLLLLMMAQLAEGIGEGGGI